LNLTFFGH